jgi:hypothetical protein
MFALRTAPRCLGGSGAGPPTRPLITGAARRAISGARARFGGKLSPARDRVGERAWVGRDRTARRWRCVCRRSPSEEPHPGRVLLGLVRMPRPGWWRPAATPGTPERSDGRGDERERECDLEPFERDGARHAQRSADVLVVNEAIHQCDPPAERRRQSSWSQVLVQQREQLLGCVGAIRGHRDRIGGIG